MCALDINAQFPGGNLILDRIEADRVYVRQDWSTSIEWWFHWAFVVRRAEGRTLTFVFGDRNVFTTLGPCCSPDGVHWRWLGRGEKDQEFSYEFGPDEAEMYFAMAPLYTQNHLECWLAKTPGIVREVLWTTEKGRPGETLLLCSAEGQFSVGLMARGHACETMASFVLEGLLEFWLRDEEHGKFLRQSVDFVAIPFCDTDGVEQGDQGKYRAPHDHNRDWLPEPRYAATQAIQRDAPQWRGELAFFLDLHCPWIRNSLNEELYFVGMPEPQASKWGEFCALLQASQTGPLHYDARHTLPHNQGWNVGEPASAGNWFAANFPDIAACSVEIPYALAGGQEVNPENLRAFGADLARTVALSLLAR